MGHLACRPFPTMGQAPTTMLCVPQMLEGRGLCSEAQTEPALLVVPSLYYGLSEGKSAFSWVSVPVSEWRASEYSR